MTSIVGVHGVGNFTKRQTAAALSTTWKAALVKGFSPVRPDIDVEVCYYSPLLRRRVAQGGVDPDDLSPSLQTDVSSWLDAAAGQEFVSGEVPTAQGRITRPLRQRLDRIARSKSLDSAVLSWFIVRFFAEVAAYLDPDPESGRARVQALFAETINSHRPQVVIAHSLGSVVAWESLWASPPTQGIDLLLTVGSPLALPHIYRTLQTTPAGRPGRPPGVARWVNLSDPGDLIAIPKPLSDFFDGVDGEYEPPAGVFDFHRVRGYLASPTIAALISTMR